MKPGLLHFHGALERGYLAQMLQSVSPPVPRAYRWILAINGVDADAVALLPVILPGLLYLRGNPLSFFELGIPFDKAKWHRKKPDRLAIVFDACNAGRLRVRCAGRRIGLAENENARFAKGHDSIPIMPPKYSVIRCARAKL
jgi:hypothetical protein